MYSGIQLPYSGLVGDGRGFGVFEAGGGGGSLLSEVVTLLEFEFEFEFAFFLSSFGVDA